MPSGLDVLLKLASDWATTGVREWGRCGLANQKKIAVEPPVRTLCEDCIRARQGEPVADERPLANAVARPRR